MLRAGRFGVGARKAVRSIPRSIRREPDRIKRVIPLTLDAAGFSGSRHPGDCLRVPPLAHRLDPRYFQQSKLPLCPSRYRRVARNTHSSQDLRGSYPISLRRKRGYQLEMKPNRLLPSLLARATVLTAGLTLFLAISSHGQTVVKPRPTPPDAWTLIGTTLASDTADHDSIFV